jgi:hypothetical protein
LTRSICWRAPASALRASSAKRIWIALPQCFACTARWRPSTSVSIVMIPIKTFSSSFPLLSTQIARPASVSSEPSGSASSSSPPVYLRIAV